MRISDWSSDVCSSDLHPAQAPFVTAARRDAKPLLPPMRALAKTARLWRYGRYSGRRAAMELLGWIMVGLFAGAIARLVMPGRDPGGRVLTILLGKIGRAHV